MKPEFTTSKETVEILCFPPLEKVQAGSVSWWRDTFYMDFKDVIIRVNLEKGRTINGQCYESESSQVKKIIKLKRRSKLRRRVSLLQDNAPVYTDLVTIAEAVDCGFELLPPYLIYQT